MSGTEQVLYANVIVDISHEKLDKIFQYRVPDVLRMQIHPGTAVTVPFGNGNRRIQGYVVKLTDRTDYPPEKIKEIQGVCAGQTGVEGKLIALAAWMRDYYGSTMIQALKAVLPVKQKVAQKEQKQIRLLLPEKEAREMLQVLEKKNQKARARLLDALLVIAKQNEKGMAVLSWERAKEQYGVTMPVVRAMEEKGIVKLESMRIYRDPLDLMISRSNQKQEEVKMQTGRDFFLNEEQQLAVQTILKEWDQKDKSVYLLHGVTGSGKTEVYMELIDFVRKQSKQAIFLIPEIALTYQMVLRFYQRFGSRVSILHSRMSAGERYDQYEKAKNGEIDIMIGPRSALFTPFSNLGIIIIDEEHEESYKSETVPRYHARETAQRRAEMEGAKLILGSATPSVESYYRAEKGEYCLLEMKRRANRQKLPYVWIGDMRNEMREGNRSILSRYLQEQLGMCLERGDQAMLFLNRRGYAGFALCTAQGCHKKTSCMGGYAGDSCQVGRVEGTWKENLGGKNMNGIDALKAKFADVELKANARTMEEVVAYIEENWGAFRVKITESELMAHYKAACEFAKMMGKDVTDFQDDIRRYRLPNTNKIHVVLGMNSEYMTAENGMKYYQALCLIKGLSQEDIDTKNERWLQYVLLLDMAKDWEKKDEIFLAEQKEMLKERGVETE